MADIRRTVDLYDPHKSYKRVDRELNISRNKAKSTCIRSKMFILQEPRVGKSAEFDRGEVTLSIGGGGQKFYLVVFVLPFSLYRFARLYHRSTRLEVIQAHIEFFHEIDSVPETIFYDRMAAVYDKREPTFTLYPAV